jgi:predicted RNase H-like nuclease (RuvC/YqgF family)
MWICLKSMNYRYIVEQNPLDDESNRWPTLLKIQSHHTSRVSKRVTQLETENSILQKQQNRLTNKIYQLESEVSLNS